MLDTTRYERQLNDYPKYITYERTDKIMKQIEKGICKIKEEKGQGTGFFCQIMNGNKFEYVLITNNHIIDESILRKRKELCVYILDIKKTIDINNTKKLYTSKDYDITIIEINKEKENIDYFLELDELALEENPEIYNEDVYIIQYPCSNYIQEASVSYGITKSCNNTSIMYLCSTDYGSSGSPILKLSTHKVIGVHKLYSSSLNMNVGSFLKQSINEYLNNTNTILNSNTLNEVTIPNINENEPLPIELGLLNINNNTSYLNSVLQLFKNFNNFSKYYLNNKNSIFINNNIQKFPLSYVTHRLFTHFYPSNGKKEEVYNPSPFLRVVNTNDNNYTRTYENNPTSLIKLILDKLDYESKQSNCINKKEIEKEDEEKEEYEEDKENLINYNKLKILENAGNNNSIISNNLNWYVVQDFQCSSCQTIWYKLLSNNTFKLNILETYNNKGNSNNYITIYDCLNYFEKTPKQESMYCIKCKTNKNITIYSKINSLSKNIIFLLDRGIFENDLIKIPFKINKVIKLDKYIENTNRKIFELTGIVSINLDENKYISYCESELQKEWYLYNDEKVSRVDINEVLDKHNEFSKLIPCILLYKNNQRY
jgi:V8-like Glu-specific endopeptidase